MKQLYSCRLAHWTAAALPLLLAACTQSPPASVALGASPLQPVASVQLGPAGRPHAAVVPADTSRNAMAAVMADVRRRSFDLSRAPGAGLTAGNYRQHLAATLGAGAYTVAADTAGRGGSAWQVGFRLRGIGRAGALALQPVADTARPAVTGGHATYQQPGFAVDYDNTEAGVRQTYRLAARPAGTGPVQVALALATSLRARPAGDSAVVFTQGRSHAPVLRYGSLRAWDATGRTLPARFQLGAEGRELALVVNDADARYPLTIDPLASTAGTTLTGQNVGDAYATSVALVGDLNGDGYGELVVGAPAFNGGAGSVYIYRGSSTGLASTATNQLLGADTDNNGASVAGAGDFNGDGYADLLVGAPGFGSNVGVAYIYAGGPSFFANPQARSAGRAGFTGSRSGTTVAGVGDVDGDGFDDFAFGGPDYSSNTGCLFIVFGNAALSLTTTTATVGGAANYRLGASLTGLGDTNGDGYADLAAGAPGVNAVLIVQGGNTRDYASYTRFYVQPSGNAATAGTSVAGPGDVNGDGYADILVGAPGAGPSGMAYLYLGSTSLSASSSQAAEFTTPEPGENFGQAVSGAGDINGDGYADFAVGAPAYNGSRGRVAITLGSALLANINNMPLFLEGATAGDQFGSSLSGGDANGDGYGDVVVGAPAYSSSTGRAYTYYGSPAALATTPTATLNNPNTNVNNDYFGISVASAGDVNGDGYADVIAGASGAGATLNGRAYLYLGSATGLATTPSTTLNAPNTFANNNPSDGDYFGWSVAGAGDVNGDGYADVLVGAYKASRVSNAAGTGNGRAYLYLGSAAGLLTTPSTTLNDPNTTNTNDYFGYSVASAGDVNGDGYTDVLVGAYQASRVSNTAATGNGRVYLYLGSATGLATAPSTTFNDPNTTTTNDYFGYSVASAGDVNGDGLADIVVGAYQAATTTNAATTGNGRAYLYLSSASGLPTTPSTTLNDPNTTNTTDNFGWSVAGAGDVNGDGYADVVVGAYQASPVSNTAASGNGRAYFYLGSATGLATAPSTTLNDPNTNYAGDNFSWSVASAGDVNSDGYADVIVGARAASTVSNAGATGNGRAYLYLGSAGGLPATPGTTLNDPNTVFTGDLFGSSVASAGDVNGDGYADVLSAAPYSSTTTNANAAGNGRAYLYLGNQGPSRAGRLRLYNTNYTPISASNGGNPQFGIGLMARNPAGRLLARVVWEVVRQGQAFSNASSLPTSTTSTGRGPWTNLPANATPIELRALVAKAGRASKVRARLEYASSPLPATTPTNGAGSTASRARYGPWTYVAAQQAGQSTSAATPLPVELAAFTATASGPAAVALAWATASEKNSTAFEVERSADGRTFERIGTVAAAGNSSIARRYELLDRKLPVRASLLYYRLRQVDQDGTFSYSAVRTVALVGAAGLSVYPNPAHGGAATLTGTTPGAVVTAFDPLGRPVASATADAAGTAALALPAGLPAGVYVVRASNKAVRLTVE